MWNSRRARLTLLLVTSLALAGCYPVYRLPGYPEYGNAPSGGAPARAPIDPWTAAPAAPASAAGAPTTAGAPAPRALALEVEWKERMAQPYVFVEHTGDYRLLGDAMRRVLAAGASLPVDGPPFALFYDDPSATPTVELRARACLPVSTPPEGLPADLRYEILPRSLVVYARVPGAYDHLGRSYGQLFAYMQKLGWQRSGPVREIYLVNPAEVTDPAELVAEVQVTCGVN